MERMSSKLASKQRQLLINFYSCLVRSLLLNEKVLQTERHTVVVLLPSLEPCLKHV